MPERNCNWRQGGGEGCEGVYASIARGNRNRRVRPAMKAEGPRAETRERRQARRGTVDARGGYLLYTHCKHLVALRF